MGHRANYVIIENGRAKVYYDHWGALSCLMALGDGPEAVEDLTAGNEETTEMMDSGWAEGGFLLDKDEQHCITFGYADIDTDDDMFPESIAKSTAEFLAAMESGPATLFAHVAPCWPGWTLEWNDGGTDAFAAHLARRKITSVKTQPATPGDHDEPYVVTIPSTTKNPAATKLAAKAGGKRTRRR